MKFLVISDIHGDLAYIEKLKAIEPTFDGILFAGDFARFNEIETGLPALNKILQLHDDVYAVLGNCDEPSFIEKLEEKDISVQGTLVFRDGLVFAGSGGALKFTGTTPNERTDEELIKDLSVAVESQEEQGDGTWPNMIAIVHQPPKDTACDLITAGIHVGSPLIRNFIQEVKPLAVVTGHIHESKAVDHIGETTIINPGSLAEGCYGILEVSKLQGVWQVTKAELKELSGN
ncbi:MAG: serine/threonine protein phosphatase [Spirochaetaceae bacterium]|nr:serine/threonine protein phosphatase [Spirochaetaceae bacterium]